ncbi:MAG: hypothetical protein KY467_02715 [Gemmatimonadetes bacterium]|nr:hypothetical protein [Gemmatimonadota bacterium]
MSNQANTTFHNARNELFSQIHRCQVLKAATEQQDEWLRDTVQYLGEIFPALTDRELNELREIGARFCQPAIPHGKQHTAITRDQWQDAPAQEGAASASAA